MFKKPPIKSLFKNKLKSITSGSDKIIEREGQFFLESTGQKLIQNNNLAIQAMEKLKVAMQKDSQ
jgi:hypothetical protein